MESFKAWLQDWSDACEYAKECAPDLASFPLPGEPYTALAAIAGVCFLIWALNERRAPKALPASAVAGAGELSTLLNHMQTEQPAKKLAA